LAHRDILQRGAILVAIGSIADIGWQPGLGSSVVNDPTADLLSHPQHSFSERSTPLDEALPMETK